MKGFEGSYLFIIYVFFISRCIFSVIECYKVKMLKKKLELKENSN